MIVVGGDYEVSGQTVCCTIVFELSGLGCKTVKTTHCAYINAPALVFCQRSSVVAGQAFLRGIADEVRMSGRFRDRRFWLIYLKPK